MTEPWEFGESNVCDLNSRIVYNYSVVKTIGYRSVDTSRVAIIVFWQILLIALNTSHVIHLGSEDVREYLDYEREVELSSEDA